MKGTKLILIAAGCVALLLASWAVVLTAKPAAEKQAELMERAAAYLEDGVYIRAVPLLEEAAGYRTDRTAQAEETLKGVYLKLLDQNAYQQKYVQLLESQMGRKDAPPGVFSEAAEYYLGQSKVAEALQILREGVARTGDEGLTALYEENRYAYHMDYERYEEASEIYQGTAQVKRDGLWGIARSDGSLLLPCVYDKVSGFEGDRAVVEQGGEIFAVDSDGNRLALLHTPALDFGSYGNDILPLLTEEGWLRANGEMEVGSLLYEELGMYAGGVAPAKLNGRWGVVDLNGEWQIPPEYDGVVQDELGRCFAQGAVFVRKGNEVLLLVDGQETAGPFEDARPFQDGYAAVRRDGRWGFIDVHGEVRIGFQYDEALSFGQHLAAVRQGKAWGYVGLSGQFVIEPVFGGAKSFSGGSAPVLTEDGWQFITLLEYEKEGSL